MIGNETIEKGMNGRLRLGLMYMYKKISLQMHLNDNHS